jgi:MFS family permease
MNEQAISHPAQVPGLKEDSNIRKVIFASSLGTLFEWYDFYLYGSLAVFFGGRFFPAQNETAQLLASLATFGAGFAVRPLGALVFGHIGDLIGRKYTFLVTMATMGLSTALVGLLPTYESIGIWATIILVLLRLMQGLALGGEYGGAATYVAEHVPDERRGYYTSYIQTTATLGFFASMAIIGGTRWYMGEEAFKSGVGNGLAGWRIPFLFSFALLAVSLYIRLKLKESPLFTKLKIEGKISKNPLKESFTQPQNLRYVLLALFGATAGQGVVWYTGQFYALTFLLAVLKLHWLPAYLIVSVALLLGAPFFLVFGHLSDKIGRKKVMLWGCLLAALTYVPIYMGMRAATPALAAGAKVVMLSAIPFPNLIALMALVFIQIIYVTMVYGPIAAFLVELFPTNIRYTSMSLPYHLGNGWFGGFLPLIATALTASLVAKEAFGANAIYAGLLYPIAIALVTVVVGAFFIKETRDHKIDTAIRKDASVQEIFDWVAVLAALGIGFVLLMQWSSDFLPDLAAHKGFLMAFWNNVWYPLIGAMSLWALPTLFFRLEFGRLQALGMVLACQALTALFTFKLYQSWVAMGGTWKFFAFTLVIGIYTLVLAGGYAFGRKRLATT